MNGYHDFWKAQSPSKLQCCLFGGCCWATKGVTWRLPGGKNEGRSVLYTTASLSHRLQLVSWTGIRRQDWVWTGRSCRGLVGKKESVWRTRAWPSLAGLHAQLLSVGRLVWLRFRAGVWPAVKGGHCTPLAVCVQAAIRRVVWLELTAPLGLLQCTNYSSTHRQKDKNNTINTIFMKYCILLLKDYKIWYTVPPLTLLLQQCILLL